MDLKPLPALTRHGLLAELHRVLAPVETYVEVGVEVGVSLALATGAGVAIGIDPLATVAPENTRDNQRVFNQSADEYWGCESCERPIVDFAFIDGSHLFEDALRDFVYIQRHAGPHSVVVFDDVLPYSQDIAWRHRPPGDWTGDVFKIPFILGRFQPRLRQILVDVAPTGALIVTGLDPADVTLDRQYDAIVEEFHHGHYGAGAAMRHWNLVPASVLARENAIPGREAVEAIRAMVAAGELRKGKVRT